MTTKRNLKTASSVTSELVLVTPHIAGEWLATNVKNRNLSQSSIGLLARDMAAGDWHFTGEPIKFDCDGNLTDGQHRLMAVMRSGKSIEFLVLRGLQPIAQDFMDSGRKRTAADMLTLRGHPNSKLLAATARFGIIYEEGVRPGGRDGGGRSVSKAEVSAYIDGTPDLADAVSMAGGLSKYLPFTPTAAAYSILLLNRIDRTECAAFFDSLANNATSGKGDPRNTLLRRMNSAKRAEERIGVREQVSFIVRAWNAHRKGAQLTVLKARVERQTGGTVSVPIPEAV